MTETRDNALRSALLDWRTQTARTFDVAACFILPQKTLDLLVEKKPLTIEALLHVHGIAELKTSYFGHEILDVIDGVLSPEERALKEYADRRPVKSRCYLHDSSDSVKCPCCGIVHKRQRSEMSSTTTLLHRIMATKTTEKQFIDKKRKLQMTRPFITNDAETCPLANCKTLSLEKCEIDADTKCEKKGRDSAKKRKRKSVKTKKDHCGGGGGGEEPILDVEFWNMAEKVKKRAKKALRKKTPKWRHKKPQKKSQMPSSIPVIPDNQSFAFSDAPDLDSCPLSTLKTFLQQSGYSISGEIMEASELRSLAKRLLPSWEVYRVISCEALPLEQRSCAILRVKSGDGSDKIRSQFRKLSLVIHPDKNPNPLASHAFYCLQSAAQFLHC